MHLFRDALNEALEKTGMTATALAGHSNINRSRLSEFLREKEPTLPKDENLVAICAALPQPHAITVAKAWVRERLGSSLSDAILASGAVMGSEIERLYASLPAAAMKAFRRLMELSREDEDLRQSIVSLAAFSMPDVSTEASTPREEETPHQPKNADTPPTTPPANTELGSNRLRKKLAAVKQVTTSTL